MLFACWNLVSASATLPLNGSYQRLNLDGTERQCIKDVDATGPRPKIRACSIADPFVLIVRDDDTIGLFIETDRGKIRRKDMSPMGDKVGQQSSVF